MASKRLQLFCIAVTLTAIGAVGTLTDARKLQAQDDASTELTVNFEADIKPILEASCIRCHGPEEQAGDFRIDDKDSVLNYLDPGDSSFSDIYDFVSTDDEDSMMPPPDEGGPLSDEAIDKIKRWIDEGADWPDSVSIVMPPPEVVEEIVEAIQEAELKQDKQENSWQLVWEIAGLLHPLVLHFPVAMLIGGAVFALFGFRGESPLSDAAYYCLWLGAWSAVLACVSGWSFGYEKGYMDWQRAFNFQKSIDIHRWGGILIAALSFLLALVAAGSRRRDPYGTGAFWKISLILLACLTGFVAHHGGKMTHDGLHDKLFNKSEILINNITGQDEDGQAEDEPVPGDPDKADAAAEDIPESDGDESSDDEGNAQTSDDDAADNGSGDDG